jgi:hypothetical protein
VQVVAQVLAERTLFEEGDTMERKATQQDIQELIDTTYSDIPLDPEADTSEIEKRMSFYLWGNNLWQEVYNAFYAPLPDYEWSPYRIELLGEELEEERYEELLDGAALTIEEEALFRDQAEAQAENNSNVWWVRIYRLALPKESNEQRAVFFTQTGDGVAPYESTESCGGPFRDVVEAIRFENLGGVKWDEEEITSNFPERVSLEQWLNSRPH